MGWSDRILGRARHAEQTPAVDPMAWTIRQLPHVSFQTLAHADFEDRGCYGCRLDFALRDNVRIDIDHIATKDHRGRGHGPAMVDELHRRYPRHRDWRLTTQLTADGKNFWPATAARLRPLGVTITGMNGSVL